LEKYRKGMTLFEHTFNTERDYFLPTPLPLLVTLAHKIFVVVAGLWVSKQFRGAMLQVNFG